MKKNIYKSCLFKNDISKQFWKVSENKKGIWIKKNICAYKRVIVRSIERCFFVQTKCKLNSFNFFFISMREKQINYIQIHWHHQSEQNMNKSKIEFDLIIVYTNAYFANYILLKHVITKRSLFYSKKIIFD